jgi:ATP-dependent DNA helicase RecG
VSSAAVLYTEQELRALLAREEDQCLEFKSLWERDGDTPRLLDRRRARDLVADVVAAFANADGGVLLLGVDDDGTPSGHAYPEEAVAAILSVPASRLRPAVRCRTARVRINGREVLVFEVPNAPEAVMVEGNGFPYRVADQIRREAQEIINQRKHAYRTVGYEARLRPEASLADIDLDLARRFLGATALGGRGIEEVLVRYGLAYEVGNDLKLTNVALLLFAEPGLRWHPRAGIRFFRVDGKERLHGTRRNVTQLERFDPPLASALPAALKFASSQVRRSEKLHDLFFRETPEYPEFAWQEALINAVAHRDYEIQSIEIEVWFYPDRMEVRSPGDLVSPVTVEELRGHRRAHASRNPAIVRLFAEARIMRDEGEGIPRMFDEMEQSFLRPPAFALDHGFFQVTLSNEPVFVGPSDEWQRLVGGLPISTSQRRVLLARPERFTNEDYRTLNQVDRDVAYREIQELVQAGIVASTGHGRGAVYRVDPKLATQRVFLESRLPRLREHFRRSERLVNAEYRALFDLTRYKAVRELQQLVADGLLRMEGERRGAVYLPRPALDVGSGGEA